MTNRMKRKLRRWCQEKGIRKAMRGPRRLLRRRGRRDAKEGEALPRAVIKECLIRVCGFEHSEVRLAAAFLAEARAEAASLRLDLARCNQALRTAVDDNLNDPTAIRSARKIAAEQVAITTRITRILNAMVEVNNQIVHINSALQGRIKKTRAVNTAALHNYAAGVCTVCSDFASDVAYSDQAYQGYLQDYSKDDEAIHALVRKYSGGNDYEEVVS